MLIRPCISMVPSPMQATALTNAVFDAHLNDAVGNVRRGEGADGIVVADLGDGDGDQIEHQLGARFKEDGILQILFARAQIFCQDVGQLHEVLEQKADLVETLDGDRGHGAVDHAVEFFA